MSIFRIHTPIPTPLELKKSVPIPFEKSKAIRELRKEMIKSVQNHTDNRLIVVTGPCSIHDKKAALEYAKHLAQLQKELKHIRLVMRVYVEKPRSSVGWKGFISDPDLDGSRKMEKGLLHARELLLEISNLDIPMATEFLSPFIVPYIEDLISWGFIGARTSSSQIHRELASQFPFPVGIKNNTDGNLQVAIDGALFAQKSHTFFTLDESGKATLLTSTGNPHTHIVLRGSDQRGNMDKDSLEKATLLVKKHGLKSGIMIDLSHGNSGKCIDTQEKNFFDICKIIEEKSFPILGLMLESHLFSGKTSFHSAKNENEYGKSITDPCMDFPTTKHLLLYTEEILSKRAELAYSL